MSHVSPAILEIRGRERHAEGIRHLKIVAEGRLEGAVPKFRNQAIALLEVNSGLNEQRTSMIRSWLAKGNGVTIESALLRMQQRIEQENSQGKKKR